MSFFSCHVVVVLLKMCIYFVLLELMDFITKQYFECFDDTLTHFCILLNKTK